jgi:hypothetical protein
MKKLLLLILLLTAIQTLGQNYHPLIRPNLYWQVLDGSGSQICFLTSGARYFFQGTTTVSGIQYNLIYENFIVQTNAGPFCPPFAVDSSSTIFSGSLMREDTLAKKVFVYDQSTTSDALLYDFNLMAGDTLHSDYASQGSTLIVDSVSNVTLLDGSVRKIFYLNNNEYYIESIGGSQGIQFPLVQGIGFWEVPTCVSENSIQLWGSQCFGFVGIDEVNDNSLVQAHPNPFDNSLTITTKNNEQSEITLYDMLSRKVSEQTFKNSATINTNQLSKGIYFYEVRNQNGAITKGKAIKQ